MFFKKKTKLINVLLVDDSEYILMYVERVINKIKLKYPKKQIQLYKYSSFDDFYKHNTNNYDIAVIDWHLGIYTGDMIVKLIRRTKYITLYSGMSNVMKMGRYAIEEHVGYISKDDNKGRLEQFLEYPISIL